MKSWFCPIVILCVCIILSFASPVIVNCLSTTEAPLPIFSAEYSADSLLVYAGSVLAGIGTILLACLSLYQNKQIHDNNEKYQEARDKWERDSTKRPFFALVSVSRGHSSIEPTKEGEFKYSVPGGNKNLGAICILENIGDGPAVNIRTTPDSAFGERPKSEIEKSFAMQGGKYRWSVCFAVTDTTGSSEPYEKWQIEYENLLGQRYYQKLRMAAREVVVDYEEVEYADNLPKCHCPSSTAFEITVMPISCQTASE